MRILAKPSNIISGVFMKTNAKHAANRLFLFLVLLLYWIILGFSLLEQYAPDSYSEFNKTHHVKVKKDYFFLTLHDSNWFGAFYAGTCGNFKNNTP